MGLLSSGIGISEQTCLQWLFLDEVGDGLRGIIYSYFCDNNSLVEVDKNLDSVSAQQPSTEKTYPHGHVPLRICRKGLSKRLRPKVRSYLRSLRAPERLLRGCMDDKILR